MNQPLVKRPTVLWPDPFRNMEELFRGFFVQLVDADTRAPLTRIKIDVSEKNQNHVMHAELPDVTKDGIDVQADGNAVSISADIRRQREEKNGQRVCAPSAITTDSNAALH